MQAPLGARNAVAVSFNSMDPTGHRPTDLLLGPYYDGRRDFQAVDLRGLRLHGEAFSGCNFRGANLEGCDFIGVRFEESNFTGALLSGARFLDGSIFKRVEFSTVSWPNARLRGVSFYDCSFSGTLAGGDIRSCSFQHCIFEELSLEGAYIQGVKLLDVLSVGTNLDGAVLVDTDLEPWTDDDGVYVTHNVTVDWRSCARSIFAPKLENFLCRGGVPELVACYTIDAIRAIADQVRRLLRSTFISYGGPDAAFARQLRDRLHRNGVETFFFELDAMAGERLYQVMRRGVNEYDRVILICSESSLIRAGVKNEIQETLAREARDGGATYLIPITLDSFVFSWMDPLGEILRDRVVADFRRAAQDPRRFDEAFQRLLRSLKRDE